MISESLIKQLIAAIASLSLLLTNFSAQIQKGTIVRQSIGANKTSTRMFGAITTTGSFPTALTNWQDGDVLQAGDLNALENTIGTTNSGTSTTLFWKLTASTSSDPGHTHSATNSLTGLVNGGIVFGKLSGGATSSANLTYSTSTGIFTVGSSSLANISSTNITVSGYGKFPALYDFNNNKYSTSTGSSFTSGVDTQVLFGIVGGGATSSALFTISTSTGVVTIASSSLTNASGTNISVSGYGLFPQLQFTGASGTNIGVSNVSTSILRFTNASGTNQTLTGFLRVNGTLTDTNNNKYSTSTGGTVTNGYAQRVGDAASGAQTIAHGLGSTPSKVNIIASANADVQGGNMQSFGMFDGTNSVSFRTTTPSTSSTDMIFIGSGTHYESSTIAVDGTNITLTWTKGGSGAAASNNILILWTAYK